MPNTKFEVDPNYPRSKCEFLPSGWFWKIHVTRGSFASFFLVDGAGLVGMSNAIIIVPNSPAAFIGQTGSDPRRKIEIYGLSPGNCLIEFRAPGSTDVVVVMQVWVDDLPSTRMSFVKPSTSAAAMIGPDLPKDQYKLAVSQVVNSGPPDDLFKSVPQGTMHIVVSTHGHMDGQNGITLSIAGGISRSNCSAAFAPLKARAPQGVVWISGCDAGSDNDFCKAAAKASGFYIVAPAIVVPVTHIPAGMIDYFERSMIKFFDKDGTSLLTKTDFLLKQRELQFALVSG